MLCGIVKISAWLALQNPRAAELFITICWFLWTRRNKSRVKEAVMPLDKLSDLVQQYLQEFQQLRGKSVIKRPPKQIIWKPPDPSTLKTNFDSPIVEDLEAAARRAVTFLQELGLGSSIFEGDFETSILAIKLVFPSPLVGHLIKNIMSSASSL
uniref:Uncharacterized protein n=1 Tax=Quercus lobata TaxID=97700 RepID=A0A7N2R197_QUELO